LHRGSLHRGSLHHGSRLRQQRDECHHHHRHRGTSPARMQCRLKPAPSPGWRRPTHLQFSSTYRAPFVEGRSRETCQDLFGCCIGSSPAGRSGFLPTLARGSAAGAARAPRFPRAHASCLPGR
jgi:hypothetical protein